MQFHIHVTHVQDPAIARELERLNRNLEIFMSDIDDFVTSVLAKVSAEKTQLDSMVALLRSIKDKLADALRGENLSPAARDKLAAIMPALDANATEITDAINANTDPAPPAPPADTPPATSTASQTSSF